jgi:hypothetical protein
VLALILLIAAFSGLLSAQSEKSIVIRLLDGKTGKPVEASNFQIRVDHQDAAHPNWVMQNADGTAKLTVPGSASLLSIHATYDDAIETFVNCDAATGKADMIEHWLVIKDILSTGMAVPDSCVNPGIAAKLMPAVKPGEIVLFVRKLNTRERMKDFSAR